MSNENKIISAPTSWKLCSYLSSCRYWCSFKWCFSKNPSKADSMSLSWARSLEASKEEATLYDLIQKQCNHEVCRALKQQTNNYHLSKSKSSCLTSEQYPSLASHPSRSRLSQNFAGLWEDGSPPLTLSWWHPVKQHIQSVTDVWFHWTK